MREQSTPTLSDHIGSRQQRTGRGRESAPPHRVKIDQDTFGTLIPLCGVGEATRMADIRYHMGKDAANHRRSAL